MDQTILKQLLYKLYGKYPRYSKLNTKIINIIKLRKESARYNIVRDEVYKLYTDGYGIKSIDRMLEIGGYSKTRKVLEYLNIEIRKGRNVVTDKLKEFRREKAMNEQKHKYGFANPEVVRKCAKYNMRGVQGYYPNSSTGELVWLRSTYEYIYAKFLNKIKTNWKMEDIYYTINSQIYRPDFFIYDDNWNLIKIVEIKGYWDNNAHKAIKLNEMLDINVIIIMDIKKYIEYPLDYHKELRVWKNLRILNK